MSGGAVRALALAYLAAMPIAWSPLPWNIKWADVLFVPLAASVLAAGDLRPIRLRPLDWLVILSLLAPIPSLLAAPDVGLSAIEYAKGIYLAAVYAVFAVVVRREGERVLAQGVAAVGAIYAAIAIAAAVAHATFGVVVPTLGEVIAVPYAGAILRVRAGTESPAMVGNLLTFAVPFAAALAMLRQTRERAWIVAVALIAIALLLTTSPSAAGFAVAVFVAARPVIQPKWVRAACAAVVLLLVLVINAALVAGVRRATVATDRDASLPRPQYGHGFQADAGAERVTVSFTYNWMSYFLIKRVALEALRDRPWTGAGLGNFHQLTDEAYREGKLQSDYRQVDPHSTWFGSLAETGVPGALALAALWVGFLGAAVALRRGRPAAAVPIALVAALAGLAVNSINADVMNFRFLWVAFGLVRGLQEDV
jgi:O-antigen ligase